MTELEKFKARAKETDLVQVSGYHGPDFKGMTEEYAKTCNDIDDYLADPINNLISRLGGECFLLEDSAHQRYEIKEGGGIEALPLTYQQKQKGKLAELIREAIETIERLRDGGSNGVSS